MKKAARPATICPGKTNELITTISIINFGRKCSLSSVNILLFPASSGLTMAYIACGLLYGKWRYVYSSFCGNDEEGKGGDLPTALLVPNPSLEISFPPQPSSTEKIVGGGQLSRQSLSPKPANYHTYGLKTFRLPSHSYQNKEGFCRRDFKTSSIFSLSKLRSPLLGK